MRPGVAARARERGRPVMNDAPSLNTRAILLLTAPLIIGREQRSSTRPLAAGEYNRLASRLRDLRRQPGDLLGDGAGALIEECRHDLDAERLDRLLNRGFRLSQAMERWRTRALWVTSRADADYPRRLRERLGGQAPPVLYGCGNRENLDSGGLAVVGSRNVDDDLIAYTEASVDWPPKRGARWSRAAPAASTKPPCAARWTPGGRWRACWPTGSSAPPRIGPTATR